MLKWVTHYAKGDMCTVRFNIRMSLQEKRVTQVNVYVHCRSVSITVDGDVTDTVNVTFGIRKAEWKAATGFYLNDEPTKILGNANHQDFAGVGVAVCPLVLRA